MKPGTLVRMSPQLKYAMWKNCTPTSHTHFDPELECCVACSGAHVQEFGECIGIVEDYVDYNRCKSDHPNYDPQLLGPEVNVRWLPSRLRYCYLPEELQEITGIFDYFITSCKVFLHQLFAQS